MTPPTVLELVFTTDVAGVERHVAELARALPEHGWRPVVVTRADANPRLLAMFREVAEVRTVHPGPALALAIAVARAARRENARVLHAHMGTETITAALAAPLLGIPAVATVHFLRLRHASRPGSGVRQLAYRRVFAGMATVIAISEAVGAMVVQSHLGSPSRVKVILNGIGGSPEDAATPRQGDDDKVLYAGRLAPEKRVDLLLQAMARVGSRGRLVIAGQGSERVTLEALATALLPGRVEFAGFVDDVGPLLRDAAMLALPSEAEPFGLIAVEAMKAGRPVLGFRSGALPEIVADGTTGILVEPGDVDAMAAAIRRLLSDAGARDQMGRAGRARYLELFTAAEMARATADVYANATGRAAALNSVS